MILRTVLLTATIVVLPQTALAQQGAYPNAPYIAMSPRDLMEQFALQRSQRLRALHDEGVALRAADGGTLTPLHRAELQGQLDEIEATYRHETQRVDPWSINSLGARR